MTPSKIFYRIKNEKYYLLNSYLTDSIVMLSLTTFLIAVKWQLNVSLSLLTIILSVVFAVINGLVVSSLLHNTSHGNVPTKILNRIVGEYCGYWVLYGFSNFCLVHILHHQHSDEELDPVNPKGMSFWVFLTAPMRYMIKTTKKYLFSVHGTSDEYKAIMKGQVVLFHLNLLLRLTIWYLLLGKTFFFLFYIPSFLTIVSIFAHINYVCHRDHVDGSVEIVNLNHNLYYNLANFFTMGGYYHKNHHINMKLFNPKFLNSKRVQRPLLSIQPKIYLNPKEKYIFTGSFLSKYLNLNNVWLNGEHNRILATRKLDRHSANWL